MIRDAFQHLEGFPSRQPQSYFDYVGGPGQAIIDDCFGRLGNGAERNFSYLVDLDKRVIESLENEFEEEIEEIIIVRRRVKRHLAPEIKKILAASASYVVPSTLLVAPAQQLSSSLPEEQNRERSHSHKWPVMEGLRWCEGGPVWNNQTA